MDGECDSLRCLCVVVCLSDFFFLCRDLSPWTILDNSIVQKDERVASEFFCFMGCKDLKWRRATRTTRLQTALRYSVPQHYLCRFDQINGSVLFILVH